MPSLIRNLGEAFWFGTLRVLEEDREIGRLRFGNVELGAWRAFGLRSRFAADQALAAEKTRVTGASHAASG